MSESYSSGTSPIPTNPKRVVWVKALNKQLALKGGVARNYPLATDPTRIIKVKLLRTIQGI